MELFSEYARLSNLELNDVDKPFQRLIFLIRDWQNYNDSANLKVCNKEINDYKTLIFSKKKFEYQETLNNTRENIKSCFENIDIFAIPHPGDTKLENLATVNYDFTVHFENFIKKTILNIEEKKILGRKIYSNNLLE